MIKVTNNNYNTLVSVPIILGISLVVNYDKLPGKWKYVGLAGAILCGILCMVIYFALHWNTRED